MSKMNIIRILIFLFFETHFNFIFLGLGSVLNGTHQLLSYADDVNILGGSAHTVKENVEALVVATKETGLEVNADKTKYIIMSQDQNAG